MKHLILITTLLLTLTSFAREKNLQGKTFLSASLGIGYGQEEGLILHANPRLLKFILPSLAIGADAEYYRENHYSRMGLGPSADLHFLRLADLDFVLGQHVLYTKESTQTPGLMGITDLSAQYSFSENFLLGLTFGKMYYLTKKSTKPKDPNFSKLAFIFVF